MKSQCEGTMARSGGLVLLCCFQLLVCLTSLTSAQPPRCVSKISSCQCQTASGKYIDLAPLAKTDDYRFKRVKGPNNWVYSYNPCYGFKCEGAESVAVCQEDTGHTSQFALGTQDSGEFGNVLGTGLFIRYTSSHTETTRVSVVRLVCDSTAQESTFQPTDDGVPSGDNTFTYSSTLTSKYACEVDSLPDRIGGGGMSAGDILLIVFFAGIFAYLLGGFVFNIAVRKTPVGPGALPNTTFWLAVLGYIQEGATFCFVKVKLLFTMRRGGSYESV